jgi:K+-transporting ATPase A subunit
MAVPDYKRQLPALGLTIQMFSGAFLGIAAQAVLAWGLIFHVMPWVGLNLLDMARFVAAFDVPLRAYQLFAGIL